MARPSKARGKTTAKSRKSRSPRGPANASRATTPTTARPKRSPASASDNELKEAREQQAATAAILKVIASSPSDVQPVFEAIVANADRLIGGFTTGVYRFVDDIVHQAAFTSVSPNADAKLKAQFPRPAGDAPHFRMALAGKTWAVADTEAQPDKPLRDAARIRGFRSVLYSPLMSKGKSIGVIVVSRRAPGPFSTNHVQLLQTFADQAVIAIENARLFNETKESLERQTATADVLKVINRSAFDLQAVLQTLVESAARLCDADMAQITRQRDGVFFRAEAYGYPDRYREYARTIPIAADRGSAIGRALLEGTAIHVPDVLADPEYTFTEGQRLAHFRAVLAVPMLRQGGPIGVIAISRKEARPFTQKQIELATTFADQAVIAIENVRLLTETREALERQTATADILKVIASSPDDVQPVFEAIGERANKLVGAHGTTVLRIIGDMVELAAFTPVGKEADEVLRSSFPLSIAGNPHYEKMRRGEIAEAADTEAAHSPLRDIARARGYRSRLLVPLKDDSGVVGAISVTRKEPGAFATHHVKLLQTFADQAVIAIQNVRLFNETREALERQTATADVLNVISRSPTDAAPVFDVIGERAERLCSAEISVLSILDGDLIRVAGIRGISKEGVELFRTNFPMPLHRQTVTARTIKSGAVVHVSDVLADPAYDNKELAAKTGYRSCLGMPMHDKGHVIGAIFVARTQPGLFSENQVRLLQVFADQAVIAIQNTRLFNEVQERTRDLSESLQQQTATADVLKVISRSAFDLQTVLDTLVESATRLCEADYAWLFQRKGDLLHFSSSFGHGTAQHERIRDFFLVRDVHIDRGSIVGRSATEGRVVHVADVLTDREYQWNEAQKIGGYRAALGAPLLRDGRVVGVIFVAKKKPEPYSAKQIELVTTFADQAVIAIENARLFDEVQTKTHDLEEALRYQTGSANILNVIASSPTDVSPVLEAIAKSACDVCDAYDAAVHLKDGSDLLFSAHHGPIPFAWDLGKRPINRHWTVGRAVLDKQPVMVSDFLGSEGDDFPEGREMSRRQGHRCTLSVPLLREGEAIGAIALRRTEPVAFNEKQIAQLQTFADQAVIAIGNVRLFDEVQARTRDLQESLQQQTAVGDVLKTISRSTFDLQPVLDTLVETAARLCDTENAYILHRDGDVYRSGAAVGFVPDFIEFLKNHPIKPDGGTLTGRVVLERRPVQILDVATEPGYTMRESVTLANQHTLLGVPLVRKNEPIGVIVLARQRVEAFTQNQIDLVTTFADQAVIAIENVRLFDQLQHRTDDLAESLQQQTATSEVLQIISSSPGELAPVFDKMLENATRVCGAGFGSMLLLEGDDMIRQAAFYNAPPALAAVRTNQVRPLHPLSSIATATREKRVVQLDDILDSPAYLARAQHAVELAELGGARTIVVVPMLRDDVAIGVMTVYRQEVRPFSDKQIELLTNFASQAVIAIENARLLRELRQRTADLSEALVYQTGSGSILKVIASSPTDVGPALQAIVESACEICDADDAVVLLKEGDDLVFSAHHGPIPVRREKWPISRRWITGRAVIDKLTVHIRDVLGSEGEHFPEAREMARQDGIRSVLSVPLLQEGEAVGAIMLRRTEAQPFSEKQIELLNSFADQAVIAISNVRLFEQVQERTRELSKSLDDLRTAQDRLVQTEKLASLGQLTAGIAHEIKNPLNFVNNFSAVSAELVDEMADVFENAALDEANRRKELDDIRALLKSNLEKVVQHGKRADSIVKNMLLHSREGRGERRSVDINALVEESLNLAYHGARAERSDFQITLERDLDPAAGQIELYPQEITRALLNMISNGFYAATRRASEAGNGYEPTLLATTRGLADRVEIRIRDNGTGIPPEVQDKMFNPFFTTKPAGEGTGLGLSMSHDIVVKLHGGTIDVETEPGVFTEFIVTLPRATDALNILRGTT